MEENKTKGPCFSLDFQAFFSGDKKTQTPLDPEANKSKEVFPNADNKCSVQQCNVVKGVPATGLLGHCPWDPTYTVPDSELVLD